MRNIFKIIWEWLKEWNRKMNEDLKDMPQEDIFNKLGK